MIKRNTEDKINEINKIKMKLMKMFQRMKKII